MVRSSCTYVLDSTPLNMYHWQLQPLDALIAGDGQSPKLLTALSSSCRSAAGNSFYDHMMSTLCKLCIELGQDQHTWVHTTARLHCCVTLCSYAFLKQWQFDTMLTITSVMLMQLMSCQLFRNCRDTGHLLHYFTAGQPALCWMAAGLCNSTTLSLLQLG